MVNLWTTLNFSTTKRWMITVFHQVIWKIHYEIKSYVAFCSQRQCHKFWPRTQNCVGNSVGEKWHVTIGRVSWCFGNILIIPAYISTPVVKSYLHTLLIEFFNFRLLFLSKMFQECAIYCLMIADTQGHFKFI